MRTLQEIREAFAELEWRVRTLEAHGRDSDIERGNRDLERIRVDINLKTRCKEGGAIILAVLGDAVIERISKVVCELGWDMRTKTVTKAYGCPIFVHPNDPEACYAAELREYRG